ncbi:hypothetical protein CEXT_252581 [Caerostris extrusa]|uniref:Uncharacterized protein n=1 Tax=Caerostris extrusa TaxID=172846 RepID=A0AAV4MXY5_CAEEX|nr:hypothetical protein CEXT_252581 [Caerostris extrusa]
MARRDRRADLIEEAGPRAGCKQNHRHVGMTTMEPVLFTGLSPSKIAYLTQSAREGMMGGDKKIECRKQNAQ